MFELEQAFQTPYCSLLYFLLSLEPNAPEMVCQMPYCVLYFLRSLEPNAPQMVCQQCVETFK